VPFSLPPAGAAPAGAYRYYFNGRGRVL
jgi:hypothetical protein